MSRAFRVPAVADMTEAQELTKRYGERTAADRLTFTVLPGRATGFLGPSDAGKSTTMRLVLGLDAATPRRTTVLAAKATLVEGLAYAVAPVSCPLAFAVGGTPCSTTAPTPGASRGPPCPASPAASPRPRCRARRSVYSSVIPRAPSPLPWVCCSCRPCSARSSATPGPGPRASRPRPPWRSSPRAPTRPPGPSAVPAPGRPAADRRVHGGAAPARGRDVPRPGRMTTGAGAPTPSGRPCPGHGPPKTRCGSYGTPSSNST